MKTYELLENDFDTSLKMTREDGSYRWIPVHPSNKDYAEYLRYTAWVEAGNAPEDFWRQDGDQ